MPVLKNKKLCLPTRIAQPGPDSYRDEKFAPLRQGLVTSPLKMGERLGKLTQTKWLFRLFNQLFQSPKT